MIYPIIMYGDPVLKRKAREIEHGSAEVVELARDLFETMEEASGIGLAAPQIGKGLRMFVVNGAPLEEEEMVDFHGVFINPQIVNEFGDPWMFEEGCLSIPDIREEISRIENIKMEYYDEHWVKHQEEFQGMKARIIQHEFDHLEGILFTDYLSAFKKRLLKGKLTNISKGKVEAKYKIKAPLMK